MAEAIARLKRSGCTMGAVKIVANGFGFTASAPLPAMDPSTLYRASRHATSIVVVEAA